ncbi:MAG: multidrug efflux pump [Sphingobacteriales bacterium]
MKEYKPTSWSIDNSNTIFIITAILVIFGLYSYNNISKELFPDIVIPTVLVGTVYPGTSPEDMEQLVTRHIEKEIKSISGLKKVTSTSIQDFSTIIAEFTTDTDVDFARTEVKEAVDRAKADLPNDLPTDPMVNEINFSEIPILFVNLSGNYDLNQLKQFADEAKDKFETLTEVTRVDIVGALEREIHVLVDMYKLQSAQLTLSDIERAIASENLTISGGNVDMNGTKRAVRIVGEFEDVSELDNIVIRTLKGAPIYLKDVAEIRDTFKEQESFSRLDHKNVITLNVVKRSGANLIETIDDIKVLVAELQEGSFPNDLNVVLTGDQSAQTRNTLQNLISSIVMGFLLVTLVLMFFMGGTNAMFVGLAVPLSMMLAFIFMPFIGFSFNMIVLFALLLALGIIVDNAIVVVENTYRILNEEGLPVRQAAKKAAGQVFQPVLAGTLTTLAPFVPLTFWPGMIGEFMFYLPITLIVTLIASLLVAFIINPVFAITFMKSKDAIQKSYFKLTVSILGSLALLSYALVLTRAGGAISGLLWGITGLIALVTLVVFVISAIKSRESKLMRTLVNVLLLGIVVSIVVSITNSFSDSYAVANFLVLLIILVSMNKFFLAGLIKSFQDKTIPALMSVYKRFLGWSLSGNRPTALVVLSFVTLICLTVLFGFSNPKVVLFPSSAPNFIYTYITMPVGTDQKVTDSVTRVVEDKIFEILGEDNPIVESVIANVGVGAGNPQEGDQSVTPNKGRITVAFREFQYRDGADTWDVLEQIRANVKDIPGTTIKVEKEQNGPPTGKPVNIEIAGDDLDELAHTASRLKYFLDSLNISGIEELASNFQDDKPEVIVDIDRVRASKLGLTTSQIGTEIRTAIYGREVSKYKDADDEYPIQLKFKDDQRNIEDVINARITYMDQNSGLVKQVPISSVATLKYNNTYGGINRKNMDRVITVSSNVLTGFTPNEVVASVEKELANFQRSTDITIRMTGEQEEQEETSAFLSLAMMISIGLIFLILVTQFNSLLKPLIILSSIILSIIGVLAGYMLLNMTMTIVMTGIGIVALAGIVVNNGILLVEFTDTLRKEGMPIRKAIIEAGRIRLTPVLLTAISTILGLIPLAIGFNIDFGSFLSTLDPKIYFGGDNVAFWGPLSWTIIFGLGFSTFLTLVLVPSMYLIVHKWGIRMGRLKNKLAYS